MKKIILLLLIAPVLGYGQYVFSTKAELQTAVDLWTSNETSALEQYGNINTWDVSNITDMSYLFLNKTTFNENINNWNTSNVTNMSYMFYSASSFNQPLNGWNTSNVTDMQRVFEFADAFNQDIGTWDTSNVNNMSRMFASASSFNQPLNGWNTSNVTDMSVMFHKSSFNQDISDWDVIFVRKMDNMFSFNSAFNQPIGDWDVRILQSMVNMFLYAESFNQSLGSWDIRTVVNMRDTFSYSNLSTANYDATLIGWTLTHPHPYVELGAVGINFCNSRVERERLIFTYDWTITDDGYNCTTASLDHQNQTTPTLYPNPTSSLLALNSDKEYDIEVYDMAGNIVMALTGNSINMEHLSTATYIVKATDKSNNEELTYKVVKN